MKSVSLALLILLALLLWMQWRPAEEGEQRTLNGPNVVSFEASDEAVKTAAEKPPKSATPAAMNEPVEVRADEDQKTTDVQAMTYLQLYRLYRQLRLCEGVIYRLLEGEDTDWTREFLGRIKNQQELNPHWPTPSQIKAVNQHASACEDLLRQVERLPLPTIEKYSQQQRMTFPQLLERTQALLLETTPESAKEIELAAVLTLASQWRQRMAQVMVISKGDDSVAESRVAAIKAEIKALEQERQQLNDIDREMRTQQESDRIHEIWMRIRRLKQDIIRESVVDLAARDEAIAAFEVVNQILFQKLKSTDPDVFYEAQLTLEMNNSLHYRFGHMPYKDIGRARLSMPFIEYVSPGDVIKNMLGFQDNETFAVLINHATKIYHCELGADCGPNGQWNALYCHVGFNYFYEQACKTDLLSFYQDHLMSANQWQDVMYVVNVLRTAYAN